MKISGSIQILGFIPVSIDEPGLTEAEARAKIEANPERYKDGSLNAVQFQVWEESKVTEDDEE